MSLSNLYPVLYEVITDEVGARRIKSAYDIVGLKRVPKNKKYENVHPTARDVKRMTEHYNESFERAQVFRRELWMTDATLMALKTLRRVSKADTIEDVLSYIVEKEYKKMGFGDLNTLSDDIEEIHRNHLNAQGYHPKVYDMVVTAVKFAVTILQAETQANIWRKIKVFIFVGFPEVYFFLVDWIKGMKDKRHKMRESYEKTSITNSKKIERARQNENIRARRFEEIYAKGGNFFTNYVNDLYLYSGFDISRKYKIKLLILAKSCRTIWSGLSERIYTVRLGRFFPKDAKFDAIIRRKKFRGFHEELNGIADMGEESVSSDLCENIGIEGGTESTVHPPEQE